MFPAAEEPQPGQQAGSRGDSNLQRTAALPKLSPALGNPPFSAQGFHMPPTNHLGRHHQHNHNSQQYVTLPGGASTTRHSGSSSCCSSNDNSITTRRSIELGAPAVAGTPVMQLQGATQYTPQVYLNAQDLILQQQQQDIACASAAAAGTLLQLQSRLPSRGGVCMLVQCPPPSQRSTLQGGLMPAGQVYSTTGGCNISGSVLGSGVMPSAGHNTSARPLGMPLSSASAVQQQGQQQHAWVQPITPAVTLVSQYGPPAQLSDPFAVVPDGLVLSSSSLLLPEPKGAFSSNSSSSIPPLQFAAPGAAVCSGPATSTGGFGGGLANDYASVAAAMAQEKLAQMQELEAQQERLRQDVITLLPYMRPGPL